MIWFIATLFAFLASMSLYFFNVFLRLNTYFELGFSKGMIFIILLIFILPALNLYGIWYLSLIHFFEIGVVLEILNFLLKRLDLKIWDITFNSFCLPIILTALIFCYGYYNVNDIKRTEYNIITNKNMGNKDYKILLLSDIHYGNAISSKNISKVFEKIKKEDSDFIILAGDVIDEGTEKDEVYEIFKNLDTIKAKDGAYLILGNHDLSQYKKVPNYSREDLKKAILDTGINLLEDESIAINDNFIITGRKDKSSSKRKASEELIKDLDKNKFLIVADHEPVELDKNMKLGYDLEVSGHTHNGQIFPANLIIKGFNLAELIYGNKKIENFNAIVSSGLSGWGYPLRTVGISEYVIINIKNKLQ